MLNEMVYLSEKGNPITDSLIVAEHFGKKHKDVLESIREIRLAENSANLFYYEAPYKDVQNKSFVKYIMTRDGFMLLVMGFTGKKALAYKIAFINAFNLMETKLKAQSPAALTGQALLSAAILEAQAFLAQKDVVIKELQPKADFYDLVTATNDAVTFEEAAKILGNIGRNKLFKELRDRKILNTNNLPYQNYMERKLFEVIETPWSDPDSKEVHVNTKTLLTQKGIDYLRKLLCMPNA